jgi:hypothetical protein
MAPPRIVFTRHADEMVTERRLRRDWIEATIKSPESVEPDPNRPHLRRAYRRIPERGGLWLRVVYEITDFGARVITAFFDRGRQ